MVEGSDADRGFRRYRIGRLCPAPTASPGRRQLRTADRTAPAAGRSGGGLYEAVTWSFVSEREAAPFGGGTRTLANPISEDRRPGAGRCCPACPPPRRGNQNRGADSIRLFEIGRRYLPHAEHPTLALLMAGDKHPRGWQAGKAAPFDAFDAKAAALALLDAAGFLADRLQVIEPVADGAIWHPGQSAPAGRLGPAVLAELVRCTPRSRSISMSTGR